MAWGRINEHRKNLVKRFIKVTNNTKGIDEKTRVKNLYPCPMTLSSKSHARLIRFFTWSKVQKDEKDLLIRIMGSI